MTTTVAGASSASPERTASQPSGSFGSVHASPTVPLAPPVVPVRRVQKVLVVEALTPRHLRVHELGAVVEIALQGGGEQLLADAVRADGRRRHRLVRLVIGIGPGRTELAGRD